MKTLNFLKDIGQLGQTSIFIILHASGVKNYSAFLYCLGLRSGTKARQFCPNC